MDNLEKPQIKSGVDYSMRSKFEAAGFRTSENSVGEAVVVAPNITPEKRKAVVKKDNNFYKERRLREKEVTLLGDVVAETLKNIDKQLLANKERNHGGNGRRADGPALAEILKSIKKTDNSVYDNREARVAMKADMNSLMSGDIDSIFNKPGESRGDDALEQHKGVAGISSSEIILKKAEAIISEISKIAPLIETPRGKAMMAAYHDYVRALDMQALAADRLSKSPDDADAKDAYSSAQKEAETILENIEKLRLKQTVNEEQAPAADNVSTETNPAELATNSHATTMNELSPKQAELKFDEESIARFENEGGKIPSQATGDSWQEAAFTTYKKSTGGEQESAPTLESEASMLSSEEKIVGVPLAGQEGAFAKFELSAEARSGLTPEQIAAAEEAINKLAIAEEAVEKRALGKNMLGKLERVGQFWNKIPWYYKMSMSVGLIATSGVIGLTAAAWAGGGMRVLGGVGMFTSMEEKFKRSSEKKYGDEVPALEKAGDLVSAAAIAILTAVILPGAVRNLAVEFDVLAKMHNGIEKLTELFSGTHAESLAQAGSENLFAAGSFIQTAQEGDSVWKMAAAQLGAHGALTDLSPEQQTYLIDSVKDQIAGHPDQFGLTDVNAIQVGQGINFASILNNKDFMDSALASAKALNPEEIANISNYAGGPAIEAIPVPEGAPHGILEQAVSVGEVAPIPAVIKVEGLEGSFHNSPNGAISFVVNGELTSAQTLESEKIFNQGWKGRVWSAHTVDTTLKDTGYVARKAATIFQYEQFINYLEQHGAGLSQQADLLRNEVTRIVTDTEKTYGDVFKNVADVYPSNYSNVPTTGTLEQASAGTMPQQIVPENPEVLAFAKKGVHDYVNSVFGSKGIFGFGAVDGMKSPNWLDIANRPVDEIMNAQPNLVPLSGGLNVGIENNDTLARAQGMILKAIKDTGLHQASGETTENFLTRAAAAAYGKK